MIKHVNEQKSFYFVIWRRRDSAEDKNTIKQARLDEFLISNVMTDLIKNYSIMFGGFKNKSLWISNMIKFYHVIGFD